MSYDDHDEHSLSEQDNTILDFCMYQHHNILTQYFWGHQGHQHKRGYQIQTKHKSESLYREQCKMSSTCKNPNQKHTATRPISGLLLDLVRPSPSQGRHRGLEILQTGGYRCLQRSFLWLLSCWERRELGFVADTRCCGW